MVVVEVELEVDAIDDKLSAFEDDDVVIEAAPEKIDVKLALFAQIEAHAPASAVIASNTSALSITEMAGSLKHPPRVAGMHFFNPVHKMKLLEIVRALETDDETDRKSTRLNSSHRSLSRMPSSA